MDEEKKNGSIEEQEDFSELLKKYDIKEVSSDSPIEGVIVDILDDKVVVDIGHKTEGILNKNEILDWDGNLKYKKGDKITVLCKNVNINEGYIIVSKKAVDVEKGWEEIVRAYNKKLRILGRIVRLSENNKGFYVNKGVDLFLPMKEVDIKNVSNPKRFLGKEYWFKVIKLNKKDKTGVVSRRALLFEDRKEKIEKLFSTLKEGDLVRGVVSSVKENLAYVDIGGFDAILLKENITYGRLTSAKQKLRKGDEIEAKVLKIDKDKKSISIGIKQRHPDPWEDIEKKYPVGKKVKGKVVKIVDYGAFVELEEGVDALLHISDLTWGGRPRTVQEYVDVGERMYVEIVELNKEERRIKVGLKQLELRPEEKYIQEHKAGEIVEGVVKKIFPNRVIIGINEHVEGVVVISDITYYRIDSPEEYLKVGDKVKAVIISDELDKRYKVVLGIKQLSDDEWRNFFENNRVGDVIKVVVKKVLNSGLRVKITENIEGYIRIGDIDNKKTEPEELKERFKPGDEIEAMLSNLDPSKKKINLSIKAMLSKKEKEEIEKYSKSEGSSVTTIGDLLQNEIDKKKDKK